MRPSDENQATSTRPNLMSASRPGPCRGGEDSILAKLERDPARRQAMRPPLRLLGAGAGAVVAAALTATLVWLAADNGKPQAMLAQAAEPPSVPAAAPPQTSGAAALIDEPPPPPPLRLLQGPSMAPPPAAGPERRPPAPVEAAADPRPRPVAAVRTERPAQQAVRRRPPAARPAPRLARAARPPAPPRQAEQAVDSDVALISAVIVHANGHAEAREEEAHARD